MSTKFTQDFNNKKCRVVWQHSFFFHEPVFSNSQANAAHSDTASVTHDSVYLHCNNMTCLSTLNVWQTALFSQNKCINNRKICETLGAFCFVFLCFFKGQASGLSVLKFWLLCRWPSCGPKHAKGWEVNFFTDFFLPFHSSIYFYCIQISADTCPEKSRHICYIYYVSHKNEEKNNDMLYPE